MEMILLGRSKHQGNVKAAKEVPFYTRKEVIYEFGFDGDSGTPS